MGYFKKTVFKTISKGGYFIVIRCLEKIFRLGECRPISRIKKACALCREKCTHLFCLCVRILRSINRLSHIIIINLFAIFSYQIADIYHAMAGHQKNTKFNQLAAYNQQNSSKYYTSQKYTMKQKKTNRHRIRQRATRSIGCEMN